MHFVLYFLLVQYIFISIILGLAGVADARNGGFEGISVAAFLLSALFWPAGLVAKAVSNYMFGD